MASATFFAAADIDRRMVESTDPAEVEKLKGRQRALFGESHGELDDLRLSGGRQLFDFLDDCG